MWAAGAAGAGAAVAWWRVVGPGFLWLAAGIAAVLAAGAVLFGAGMPGALVVAAASTGLVLGRRPRPAAVGLGSASVLALLAGLGMEGGPATVTGALLLGGVTGEMMLGHWYLVDPRLPRWVLRRLDVAAGAGLVADTAMVLLVGRRAGEALMLGWPFAALALLTGVLLLAVWSSLRQPSYSGVMAATGLSYLAVMTALGAVVTGRLGAGALGFPPANL